MVAEVTVATDRVVGGAGEFEVFDIGHDLFNKFFELPYFIGGDADGVATGLALLIWDLYKVELGGAKGNVFEAAVEVEEEFIENELAFEIPPTVLCSALDLALGLALAGFVVDDFDQAVLRI